MYARFEGQVHRGSRCKPGDWIFGGGDMQAGIRCPIARLQSRLKGILVPVDPNPQLVSVLVSESEQDQARVLAPTMPRRRVPPPYALAYSVRLVLSQARSRHRLPRQNLNIRLSRWQERPLPQVERRLSEWDRRVLFSRLSLVFRRWVPPSHVYTVSDFFSF